MSTDTARPVRQIALTEGSSDDGAAERATQYRARVEALRRGYSRRVRRYGIAANGVSLLLAATGAAVGLTSMLSPQLTVALGVMVILLEGITQVLHPALRAARARWVTHRLDREFRLYDARGRGYDRGDADQAFVTAVERILERADAAEEHDETGTVTAPTAARKAG